jgi:deoxyadenosine/deoxycytidine kinase
VSNENRLVAERHELNCFWGDDQANGVLGFLAYDLSFLLQHAHLLVTSFATDPEDFVVSDWSFVSDRLWASMRLESDLAAYEAVHRAVLGRVGPPIGYLYLRQPVEVIVQRLATRGREAEASLVAEVADAVARLDEVVQSLPANRVVTVGDDLQPDELLRWATQWQEARRSA